MSSALRRAASAAAQGRIHLVSRSLSLTSTAMAARHASSSSSAATAPSPAPAAAPAAAPSTTPAASASAVDSTLEMLQRKHLNGRIFTFNRPAAYNALNLNMIRSMTPQLKAWESSDACNVILLRSDHNKAFCAGGDVKTLVDHIQKGEFELATQFMKEEYQLNHMIATTPKPFVALCDGITMGGGVGLSVHAPFRVATEKTLFAMPETAIGLFPDVGGTFFLPRLDGELGTYLALTGDRLVGSDVVAARVATHFVPSERMPALTDRLCELEVSDWGVVNAAIEEYAEAVPAGGMAIHQHRALIDKCFKGDSIEAIFKALEADGSAFALKTLDTLRSVSPMSLHVTLAQMRRGKDLDVAKAFQFEWALVNNVLRHPDFVEGVTTKLINKPATAPTWPSAKQSAAELAALLVPMQHLPGLPLARATTYDQYPHRFLALPAEADVRSVVKGEEQHVGDFAFMSIDEVVEFFATHWPFRHLVADGIKDLNAMRRNAAGANAHQAAPIGDLEMQVGAGKVGVREHVREIVDRCCSVDEVKGVKWVWGEAK